MMPDDNPYAPPQTIGSRAEQLPLAQDGGRQRFPEWDTAYVTRLADYGHAIQQLTSLCLGLLVFLVLGFVASYLRATSPEIQERILLFAGLLLTPLALRVWWGFHRAGWMRHCSMVFDCLATVLLGMLVLWSLLLLWRDEIHVVLSICVLGFGSFLAIHAASSFLAHVHARELFGPDRIRQDDLSNEADYRRRHGIG